MCVCTGVCNWVHKKIEQLALNLLSQKTISLSSQQNNPNIPDSPNQQPSHKESEKETETREKKKILLMLRYIFLSLCECTQKREKIDKERFL